MKRIQTLNGQTLVDIAIQELGDADRVFEIATMNGLSLTDELEPGRVLMVPEPAREMKSTVQIFQDKAFAPASADAAGDMETKQEGIGYWIIGNDFKVS